METVHDYPLNLFHILLIIILVDITLRNSKDVNMSMNKYLVRFQSEAGDKSGHHILATSKRDAVSLALAEIDEELADRIDNIVVTDEDAQFSQSYSIKQGGSV